MKPDRTILIDIDPEASLARARARSRENSSADRMEEQSAGFHRRVREAYLSMAAREPARFRVIDGRGAVDQVAEAVWRAVVELLR
jgi:dTMP kinase